MPTYEYACRSCGEHLEVVQSFKDEPLTECPACQGALRKVFSPIGITFKGSGFYKTDSRSAAASGASKASEPSSDTSATSGASTGSDSSSSGSSGSGSSSGTGSSSSTSSPSTSASSAAAS